MTDSLASLYTDEDTGRRISTHSMLKSFRHCPREAYYKYYLRLKPRTQSKPLTQGTWMHKLLETHYKGGEWRDAHRALTAQFSELFDEEKEALGDLPRECARMMRAYLWHYKNDVWKVLEVEFILEVDLPDGTIYRGKIDLLVEDQWGDLWIVDHKFNQRLPDNTFRILDSQSALYVWAALRSGIPVKGHQWNYVRRKAPSVPQMLQSGVRLSRRKCDTEYTTYVSALKKYGLNPKPYKERIRYYKSLQYVPGEPNASTFFRRNIITKTSSMLRQVAQEANHTSQRMHSYPFNRPAIVERVPGRPCGWCTYRDLCTTELYGGNTEVILRRQFREVDPMAYYYDELDIKEKELDVG